MDVSVRILEARYALLVPLDVFVLRQSLVSMVAYVLRNVPFEERKQYLGRSAEQDADLELCLTLVRDARIWSLNIVHLSGSSPTNVLSFPLSTPFHCEHLVPPAGDLLLSVDTLSREAFLYGQDPTLYAVSLLAHGVAHLAGLDHGEAMLHLEYALLGAVSQ